MKIPSAQFCLWLLTGLLFSAGSHAADISNQATVSASSIFSAGFAAENAIDDDLSNDWASNGEGVGAWLELSWSDVYTIDSVTLYDRANPVDQVTSLELQFSDGTTTTTIAVGQLDNAGAPREVAFVPVDADRLRIVVTGVSGTNLNVGLAEVEVSGVFNGANRRPVANAGFDQTVNEGEPVTLDGSASSDPDGDPITFQWTQTAGPAVALSDSFSPTPAFLAPSGLAGPEVLSFSLIVGDGVLNSTADSVDVTVTTSLAGAANIEGFATATASSIFSGSYAAARAIDDDVTGDWASNGEGVGAWLELSWSDVYSVDRVILYDRANSVDQVTSLELQFSDGTTTTTIAVGQLDNAGAPREVTFVPVDADRLRVVVTGVSGTNRNVGLAELEVFGVFNGANRRPVANAGTDQTVHQGDLVNLDGSASSDPDGDPITYEWTQTAGPAVALSDSFSAAPAFLAPNGLAGPEVLSFSLTVGDGALNSTADSVDVTVTTSLAGAANIESSATATASSIFSGNYAAARAIDDDATRDWATNGEGVGAWLELSWSDVYTIDRVTLYDRANPVDQVTSLELQFSDGTTTTTIAVGQLDNAGAPREVAFVPVDADRLRIVVTGVSGTNLNVGLAELEVFGVFNGANRRPVANAGIDQTVTEGDPVTLDGSASSDPDGDPITYQWTQTAGPAVVLSDSFGPAPTFSAPSGLAGPEVLSFSLVVGDGALNSIPDSVDVTVTASLAGSGNIEDLAAATASSIFSGSYAAARAIDDDVNSDWATNGEGVGAWLELFWSDVYTIDRVTLYDRANSVDQVTSLELQFSDGTTTTTIAVGQLDNAGAPRQVAFVPVDADRLRIVVTGVSGTNLNVGLAELEVFGVFNGANRRPVADAGIDQIVNEGDLVTLDGSASSDLDGDPLTYQWTQTAGPAVALSDSFSPSPTFSAPSGLAGPEVLSFSLLVDDGALSSISDSVDITVVIPPELPGDIVHYFRFDEVGGALYSDIAQTSDATCTNCPAPITGLIGGAQQFDGFSNDVSVAASPAIDWAFDQSFTVEFWLNTDSCVGQQAVVGRDDSNTNLHWWVGCENGNATFTLIDKDGTGAGAQLTGTSPVDDSNWHHIVAIRDAFTNTNHLVVDGVEEASVNIAYTSGFDSTVAALNIGWLDADAPGYHFNGAADEIAIVSRVLSAPVVNQHYNDGRVGLQRGIWSCGITPIEVMAVGDSITTGQGSLETGGFRGPLQSRIMANGFDMAFVGRKVDSIGEYEGWGGYSPSSFPALLPGAFLSESPDVILLHIGTNLDFIFPATDHVASTLDTIFAYAPNAVVVLAKIVNRSTLHPATSIFNNNLQAMADQRIANGDRIVVVDMENALNYPSDMDDYLHPNSQGYMKMAAVWEEGLRSFIAPCLQVAPVIFSTPLATELATVGSLYVHDVDGFVSPFPSYSLLESPPGMTIHPDTGRITWLPTTSGAVDVTVQVSNDVGFVTQTFVVNATLPGYANIAPLATVTASSHFPDHPASNAVDGVVGGFPNEWASNGERAGAWIQLDWAAPQFVDSVVLYDRINSVDQITSATLSFDDGSTVSVSALDNGGGANVYSFASKTVSSIRLNIDSTAAGALNIGLAEIEVFGVPL